MAAAGLRTIHGEIARPARSADELAMNYQPVAVSPNTPESIVEFLLVTADNSVQSIEKEFGHVQDYLTPNENADVIAAWTEYTEGRTRRLAPGWRLVDLLGPP